ncbi:aspartic peptidase domain-containing protein [Trametes meyenii]|nr:aspartic peptidase domain-containing protein [Trametes meyenii]
MHYHSLVTLLSTSALLAAASPVPDVCSIRDSINNNINLNAVADRLVPASLRPTLNSGFLLPFTRHVNSTGSANLVKFDQARAQAKKAYPRPGGALRGASAASSGMFEAPGTSRAVSYTVTVSIGSPPTTYELLIDTGSANTFVGAGKKYVHSDTARATGEIVSVTYGSGYFMGQEFIDTVTLAPGLTIGNQSFGVAMNSSGFDGVDGILGVGPQGLTRGSLSLCPETTIPTVTDNGWNAGYLDKYEIGISFQPTRSVVKQNGELTFGGTDPTKYMGDLQYGPMTNITPASHYVGYVQSIRYGDKGPVLKETAGILDTGTTLTLIASDAFKRYQNYTGGVLDDDTGLLRITKEQYGNLKNLYFKIGDEEYVLTPNAQIWPRALNEQIGGSPDGIYLIVNDLGEDSGEGLDFINGMTFLERYYAVYDVGNSRIALAKTKYTDADVN